MNITSRKQAIDENCRNCIYDPQDRGTWRDQVTNCTVKSCALYGFRPLNKQTLEERKKAKVAAMSPEELKKYQSKQDQARERFSK